MELLTQHTISCPYCGEGIDIVIDGSVPQQEYTEDCEVCCQPMIVTTEADDVSGVRVTVRREDD